jgi:hypothetical protein
MNHDEYEFLTSEIFELESILAQIPADRVIDRTSFESRLKRAKETIARIAPAELPKKARLTFRGNPVFGSYGVAAEFASKASASFTEAFAAIVAALNDNLRYMGPIPDKQRNQLIITGTAIGSFGFEYELPPPNVGENPAQCEMDFGAPRNTEVAMEKIEELFRVASSGDDDELSDLVDEIHPRAIKKVAEFLDYLGEHEAWCGLEFDQSLFRFTSSEQVQQSATRLQGDNIKEATEEFSGRFEGALPTGRQFEFKPLDRKGIVRGKVGSEIQDVHVINREYLTPLVTVTLQVIQVGQGRPRYTLAKLEDIKPVP